MSKKAIVADNQELTNYAIRAILSAQGIESLTSCDKSSLMALLNDVGQSDSVVVVVDYALFDFDNEEQLLIISQRFPRVHWIVLSDELRVFTVRKIVYASQAFSIVFKDCSLSEIETSVDSAFKGEQYICSKAQEMMAAEQEESPAVAALTSTEMEIACAIARGFSTKEIATQRFSSVHTITTHRKNIFRKLNVGTAHEVMRYALRAGWIDAADFCI